MWLRSVGVAVVVGCIAAPAARAGEPAVGLDVGAAIPIDKFQDTADPGGALSPWVGYQFGDAYAFTPFVSVQYSAFQTAVEENKDADITSLFSVGGGGRFSLRDEHKEVFFSAQGGWYTDVTGPVNDNGGGFAIAGGANYEFGFLPRGMALGLYVRYDQSSQHAARNSYDDLKFLTSGFGLHHRFLPPPPPPPAPILAQAPPPPPAPVKRKIVLRGVNFDFDKSDIRADARPVLNEAVATLKTEGVIRVVAEGHTDGIGSDSYNEKLSQRRAAAVKAYLVKGGIDASRIETAGFGESRPVATNDTADGRAQNRRVELRIKE
jgi:outer membrane protein OmpA-like peptidoglycan-associated protein